MKLIKNLLQDCQDLILGGVIIAGVLILSTVYLGSASNDKELNQKSSEASSFSKLKPENLQQADYYLKATEINRNIRQLNAQVENSKILFTPDNEDYDYRGEDVTRFGLRQSFEEGARGVEKELDRERRADRKKLRMADKIEMKIAQEQFAKDYENKYEEAFVNHFIDNMEKSGYEVQINNKLQVVRVKKIQNP